YWGPPAGLERVPAVRRGRGSKCKQVKMPREGDPEGAIKGRETRSGGAGGQGRELVAQRELDDRLVLAAPEECHEAPEDRDRESRCRPHRGRILLESRPRREPESGPECAHTSG